MRMKYRTEQEVAKHFSAIGKRIYRFPEWIRIILLEDIDSAIKNRISIFEMIDRKLGQK